MVLAKPLGTEAARAGRDASPPRCAPMPTSPRSTSPVRASSICACPTRFWQAHLATILAAGDDYGRSTVGAGRKVNVEYVSANPTGPDACRPLPRRGGRRCAGQSARLRRLRRHQGILHQRRRRADRRARRARRSCATARRWARRSARSRRASIPATISCRSARRWRPSSAAACCRCPRTRRSPIVKDRAIDAMMAMIREDLAAAQRPSRRVLLRAHAACRRRQADPRGDQRPDAARAMSTRARCRRRRARCPTTGRTASRRCSARPRSATTSTGRWSSRTAPTPISPPTSPISRTSSIAASTS